MRLDQLYYLIDIAKTQSISTTAQRIFASQQAVSEAIRKMEKELGTTLLFRSKTGVSLTKEGEKVVAYSLDILEIYQEMLTYLAGTSLEKQPVLTGNLTICASPVIANTLLPEVIYNYSTQFPEVNISICEAESSLEVIHNVLDGDYHLGLISVYEPQGSLEKFVSPEDTDRLNAHILFSDFLVVCVSHHSNLALEKSISLGELNQNYKQTMYSSSHSPTPHQSVKNSNILFTSNNTDLHKKFISQELAVCAMPHYAFEALFKGKEFTAIPLTDAHSINTYLINAKSLVLAPAISHFIDLLQSFSTKFNHH